MKDEVLEKMEEKLKRTLMECLVVCGNYGYFMTDECLLIDIKNWLKFFEEKGWTLLTYQTYRTILFKKSMLLIFRRKT